MRAGTALISSHQPSPELAEMAVNAALARAGMKHAAQVILLLSRDFLRKEAPAIVAAARAAGCLQVAGMTASGLFTEQGWQLDQPAAAALVLSDPPNADSASSEQISFTGQ